MAWEWSKWLKIAAWRHLGFPFVWFHGSPLYFPDGFLLTSPDERGAAPIHFGPDWEHAQGCKPDAVFIYTLESDDPTEHLKLKSGAYEAKWALDCRYFYEVEPTCRRRWRDLVLEAQPRRGSGVVPLRRFSAASAAQSISWKTSAQAATSVPLRFRHHPQ